MNNHDPYARRSSWATSIASTSFDNATMTTRAKTIGSEDRSCISETGTTQTSLYIQARLVEAHWLRRFMFEIIQSTVFSNSILLVIILNTVLLTFQINPYVNLNYGWYLTICDQIFLGIYLTETISKLFVFHSSYFKSGWNVFDFCIVSTGVFTFAMISLSMTLSSFDPNIVRLFRVVRTLRAIRSLRALRAISFLKNLQVLVEALLSSLPAMSSLISMAGLVLYIFSVIARSTYADSDPRRFGSVGTAFFWMFSTMTLDNWADIWRENINAPGIFPFLVIFLVLENFVLLNLFIAVMVSNLDESREKMNKIRRRDLRNEDKSKAMKLVQRVFQNQDPDHIDTTYDHALRTSKLLLHEESMGNNLGKLHDLLAKNSDFPTDMYYTQLLPLRTKRLLASHFQNLCILENDLQHYHTQSDNIDNLLELLSQPVPAPSASSSSERVYYRASRKDSTPDMARNQP